MFFVYLALIVQKICLERIIYLEGDSLSVMAIHMWKIQPSLTGSPSQWLKVLSFIILIYLEGTVLKDHGKIQHFGGVHFKFKYLGWLGQILIFISFKSKLIVFHTCNSNIIIIHLYQSKKVKVPLTHVLVAPDSREYSKYIGYI